MVPAPQPEQPTHYVSVTTLKNRLKARGLWEVAAEALPKADLLELATLKEGVDPADPRVIGLLLTIGADPDVILAPEGSGCLDWTVVEWASFVSVLAGIGVGLRFLWAIKTELISSQVGNGSICVRRWTRTRTP